MHKEILNNEQLELLPLIKEFKREFYLVSGTAIALYLGHRRSIDFDLFKPTNSFDKTINIPSLLDLAAMKAYALGRSSKWKDYVDLYFIIKNHYNLIQIAHRASEIYDQLFSQKLFLAQLSYFNDIDYTEEVEFLVEPDFGYRNKGIFDKCSN